VNWNWYLVRGSGLAAYGLLALATIWGVWISTPDRGGSTQRLIRIHESLTIPAVVATAVHMTSLLFDSFVHYSVADLFIPLLSTWRPVAVTWGIVAMYGLVVITASFYLKGWIGQRNWRLLHYSTYLFYLVATVHGIQAGADRRTLAALLLYAGTAAVVVYLTTMRVLEARAARLPVPGEAGP